MVFHKTEKKRFQKSSAIDFICNCQQLTPQQLSTKGVYMTMHCRLIDVNCDQQMHLLHLRLSTNI